MLIFGIDTCCAAATAALMDDERMIAETVVNHKRTHSQKMMPQVEQMFANAEIDVRDVDVFAAAVGPGSFTGVRIGVATAKALAQANGKPCAAVSTLHALAHQAEFFDGIVCPILDARRNQVYNALFVGGKSLTRLCEDRALALDDLLGELLGRDENVLFLGDGVAAYRTEIEEKLKEKARFAPKNMRMNLGGSVAELGLEAALRGDTMPYGELIPSYVRLSQAEQALRDTKAER